MALTNSQYDSIIRDYEEQQMKNRKLLRERTEYVYSHIEGYRELDESIASVSVSQGKKLLEGDENALSELKSIISNLSSMKKQLLLSANLPADYLEPVYRCPDCKDTGYINSAKCHCFKQAEITMLYEQSGIREMLEEHNFSTLSYEYYDEKICSVSKILLRPAKILLIISIQTTIIYSFMVQWVQANPFYPVVSQRN